MARDARHAQRVWVYMQCYADPAALVAHGLRLATRARAAGVQRAPGGACSDHEVLHAHGFKTRPVPFTIESLPSAGAAASSTVLNARLELLETARRRQRAVVQHLHVHMARVVADAFDGA